MGAVASEKQFENVSATFLQSRGSGPPVLFFPAGDLGPWYVRHLARSLGEDQPFIVLRHELTEPGQFEEFASRFVKLIRILRPEGPLVLAGHCYGGILAYEVAQRLRAEGQTRFAVILINVPAPGYTGPKLERYFRYLRMAALEVLRGRGRELVGDIRKHLDFLRKKRYKIQLGRDARSGAAPQIGLWEGAGAPHLLTAAGSVIRRYVPGPYPGRIAHILAIDQIVSTRVMEDPRLGWRRLLRGNLDECGVRGDHNSIFEEQNAANLAKPFRAVIQAIEGPGQQ